MKLPPTSQQKTTALSARTAFTLVELLVVIAIIVVLVSLLMVGVFKALDSAYEAQTRTDVTQLGVGIAAFQEHFKVTGKPPPSRLVLCKLLGNYYNPGTGQPWTPLHQDSLDYLQQVFPRITSPTPATSVWATTGIDWNQNGLPDPQISLSVYPLATPVVCNGWVLEGEQCLVFWIGGIPSLTSAGFTMTGFSTNPANPAAPGGDRIAPFMELKSSRLVQWNGTAPGFPSYLDGYGSSNIPPTGYPVSRAGLPYAYFSSYKAANNYNRYVYISNPYLPLGSIPTTSDCHALGEPSIPGNPTWGVWPYAQSMGALPVYLNSQTFQIISGGKNGQNDALPNPDTGNIRYHIGTGTVISSYPGYPGGNTSWSGWTGTPVPAPASITWAPNGIPPSYVVGKDGSDDIANFYDRLLGVPTQ